MERLIPISSSFVRNDIKLRSDKGSGEAKLFLGSTSDLSINEFFNNFNENNKYIIYKEELLNYFYKIFIEFIAEKCNNYKNVGLSNYLEKLNELNHLDNKIEFKMEKFSDKKRIYIRPIKSDKWIFDNIIRNIALPKITNLIINKISQNVFHIKIDINVNEVLNRDVSNFESLSELEIISNYLNYQIRYHQKEKDLEEFILELKESREQFLSRFSLEIVADKKIEKNELNKILFGKKEDNSLLYNLAENFSIFGSAKQSNTTPVNWNSELFISHLVDIDNYLLNNDVLSSKDNYEELYKYINNLNENYLKRIWFKKYLHILYPTIFPSQHSDENKKEVLRLFSLDIEDSEIDRAWKLLQLEKISNIPGDYYWRII